MSIMIGGGDDYEQGGLGETWAGRNCIAIGNSAIATGVSSVAIGVSSYAHSGEFVIGSSSYMDVIFKFQNREVSVKDIMRQLEDRLVRIVELETKLEQIDKRLDDMFSFKPGEEGAEEALANIQKRLKEQGNL